MHEEWIIIMAILSATFVDIHLSEEDIKSRYIQPALDEKGWNKKYMQLEFAYTSGQIVVQPDLITLNSIADALEVDVKDLLVSNI